MQLPQVSTDRQTDITLVSLGCTEAQLDAVDGLITNMDLMAADM